MAEGVASRILERLAEYELTRELPVQASWGVARGVASWGVARGVARDVTRDVA